MRVSLEERRDGKSETAKTTTRKPLHELPWMRVSAKSATYAVAVEDGRVVGGAPYGMKVARKFNYDARRMWVELKRQGAELMRLDP